MLRWSNTSAAAVRLSNELGAESTSDRVISRFSQIFGTDAHLSSRPWKGQFHR